MPFGGSLVTRLSPIDISECRLCIQAPFAGGRVFETGDEEFLAFTTKKGEYWMDATRIVLADVIF